MKASFSIGLSLLAAGDDPASLLDAADAAMYQAKRRGGDSFAIRDPARSAARRSAGRPHVDRAADDTSADRPPELIIAAESGGVDIDVGVVL